MNPVLQMAAGMVGLATMGVALRGQQARARARAAGLERRLAALRARGGTGAGRPGRRASAAAGRGAAPPMPARIAVLLARADLRLGRADLLIALAVVLAAAALGFVLLDPWVALAVAASCAVVPVIWVRRRAARRIARLVAGLPAFLDTIRQLLTSGSSLQQSVARAILIAEPAVETYLQPVARRVANGAPVPESISAVASRLACTELHMLSMAVQVNLRHGGRMGPMLANLAGTLREQSRIERELRAATAETRLSALVASALPPLATLGIALLNPAYPDFFLHTARGHTLGAVALGFELAGIYAMRRIMRLSF